MPKRARIHSLHDFSLFFQVCRKTNKVYKFLLFTDLLVYGRIGGNDTLIFHRAVDLKSAEINDNLPEPNAFCVLAAPKSFTVIANDVAEKNDWVSTIKKNNEGCTTGGQKAAVWLADKNAKRCPLCNKNFTFIRRRHHCRQCGGLVCGDCSKHSVLLPHIHDKKKQRVCDKCFGAQSKVTHASSFGSTASDASFLHDETRNSSFGSASAAGMLHDDAGSTSEDSTLDEEDD